MGVSKLRQGWVDAAEEPPPHPDIAPSPGDTEPCDQHQALGQNSGHFCCNSEKTTERTGSSDLQTNTEKEGAAGGRGLKGEVQARGSILKLLFPC